MEIRKDQPCFKYAVCTRSFCNCFRAGSSRVQSSTTRPSATPLSKSGAELLFETFSQRYERASTLVTSNLPFEEWTEVFGSERLTGALLDRHPHPVPILEMNRDSYRPKQGRRKRNPAPDR